MPAEMAVLPVWRRVGRGPLLVAAPFLAGAVVLRARDPHIPGSWGACPFLALTGVPCPGCGGLRAVHDLTRGDIGGALGSNLYAVLTLAALVVLWLAWVAARARTTGRGGHHRSQVAVADPPATRWAMLWLAGLLAFGVLRLLGPFQALQP